MPVAVAMSVAGSGTVCGPSPPLQVHSGFSIGLTGGFTGGGTGGTGGTTTGSGTGGTTVTTSRGCGTGGKNAVASGIDAVKATPVKTMAFTDFRQSPFMIDSLCDAGLIGERVAGTARILPVLRKTVQMAELGRGNGVRNLSRFSR